MKKKMGLWLLLACLSIFLLAFPFIKLNQTSKAQVEDLVQTQKYLLITDSLGRSIQVPYLPQRIISVNSDVSEVICALGESDKIIGVSNTTEFPLILKNKAKVGEAFTPSTEKIVALKPDLVLGYSSFLKPEIITQIEQAGIPVVVLDCYKLKTLKQDILTLGKILGKEQQAEEYNSMLEKYEKMIAERINKLPPAEKPLTYVESYSDYSTVATGIGGADLLKAAGGINAAKALQNDYPKVSAEWVVTQNPQVIIKAVGSRVLSGYGQSSADLEKEYARIMSRTGWEKIDAVQQKRVYLISNDIWVGPRGVVGIAYLAKWLHPDLFQDLDPEAIHRDILKKYHHLELKGNWIYPNN